MDSKFSELKLEKKHNFYKDFSGMFLIIKEKKL